MPCYSCKITVTSYTSSCYSVSAIGKIAYNVLQQKLFLATSLNKVSSELTPAMAISNSNYLEITNRSDLRIWEETKTTAK